ncbi:MAG: hypothetical protein K2N90_00845, partial [Lachnospiraceae bacterium]|nr:hypothetical protein [Lachnospiraceae bacterium]
EWTVLFLFLITSTALLTYLHFFAAGDKDLSGNWITKPDMTKQAAVTALSWLQDIDAVSVSLEDMEAYMQGLTIEVKLTLDQNADSEGTFHCNVLPESYDACNQAAYEAFAAAFRDLLVERLLMAGYTGGTDDETIEALVTETFGMPTVSYLMSCAPELLPPIEDLQAQYDGSGTYITSEGMLIRQYDAEGQAVTKTESYIRKDSKLILTEETDSEYLPTIYILQQSQNQ